MAPPEHTTSRTDTAGARTAALTIIWPAAGRHTSRMRTLAVAATAVQIAALTGVAWCAIDRSVALWLIGRPAAMWATALTLAALAAARAAVTLAAWTSQTPHHRSRVAGALIGAALTVGAAAPPLAAAAIVEKIGQTSDAVFVDTGDGPIATPDTITTSTSATSSAPASGPASFDRPTTSRPATTDATTPTTTSATTTSVTPAPSGPLAGIAGDDGRWNVLLLGGDAGPRRWGLRTDTIAVASFSDTPGDVALISIPRNIQRVRFPTASPLAERFPNGFDDLLNAVYGYGAAHPELRPDLDDTARGAWATASAVAQLTGLRIDDWVLVDMGGFVQVVDAIGGITVHINSRVPLPPDPWTGRDDIPTHIEPGVHTLNGAWTLAYARSRQADSDYARMGRQRCVLGAIASQIAGGTTVLNALDVLDAVGDSIRTSADPTRLEQLARFGAQLDLTGIRTAALVPPQFTPSRPDEALARQLVNAAIMPADDTSGHVDAMMSAGSGGGVTSCP